MVERKLTAMVRALHDAGAEFLVVGELSAVLNGAPVNTYDVHVVHRRTPGNVDRILSVLDSLNAVCLIQPQRRLRPVRSSLMSTGHQNLITKYGPLDLLGEIGDGLGYDELLPRSAEILIAEGVRVRVLNLETLIEVKEQLNGEKDRAMLPLLRRTLEESKRKSPGGC
jgi:predicted nucleotidyltransferase